MTDNIFEDALTHLDHAKQYSHADDETIERLKHPKSALEFSIPVRMDNGSLKIFTGYRVRYNDSR
ncbi:MAG: glutamate dehydrogenase, partial [Coxiellaceae bacterium]|nr:glutamate dehydrogenase [Coxiellaceae bacterium]